MGKLTEAIVVAGVSQATFGAHTHNYRKLTQIGVSRDEDYDPAVKTTVIDDTETMGAAGRNLDLEAIAVTVATQSTGVPN